MSDDTPTQRFDAPLTPSGPSLQNPAPDPGAPRSRGLLIALIAVGALLLVAIIVVIVLLLGRGSTPTAAISPTSTDQAAGSATPTDGQSPTSAAPTATAPAATAPAAPPATTAPKPPAAPPATGLAITSFTSPTAVKCKASGNSIYLDFSWSGSGGVAYFAVGSTNDPKDQGFNTPMPPTGTQNDFPDGNMILYPCGQATADYTLGMYDASGHSVIKHLTVKNTGVVGP